MTTTPGWADRRIRDLLTESLGEQIGPELFTGFLVALGAAVVRGGPALVRDPLVPGRVLVAECVDKEPLVVQVPGAGDDVPLSGLDTAISAVLAACARHHRMTTGRLPWLAELLDAIARAANGLVTGPDGDPVRLRSLRAYTRVAPDSATEPGQSEGDWRDAATLLLTAGRLGLRATTPIPSGPGLREHDHRVLLALRDLVAARSRGVRLEPGKHPDPDVARLRTTLIEHLVAVLDSEQIVLPGPDSPAYLLTALLDPERVRRDGTFPPQWRLWLEQP